MSKFTFMFERPYLKPFRVRMEEPRKFIQVILGPRLWGRLVESSVGAHLLNYSLSKRYNIYYWREANDEVDFVLETGLELCP